MKNHLAIAVLAVFTLFSCSKSNETISGFKFSLLKKGEGPKIDSGKYAVVHFFFSDAKDSIWNDTRKSGFPAVVFVNGNAQIKGDVVMEVVKQLGKGDSATFKVKAKPLFQNTFRMNIPYGIDTAQYFTFHLGVSDVLNDEQRQKLQADLVAKENAKMMKAQQEQLAKDTVLIDDHLKAKNIAALKTKSGIRYVITKPGKGENAKPGEKVKINYCGYLLSGKYFDCSDETVAKEHGVFNEGRKPYGPLDVTLGYQQVIAGWEEAIQLMNKGCKMTVYIPSTLAYGNQRRGEIIVENSVLGFDMELLDIKK